MNKRTAIVTGASSGMGKEFALRVAKEYEIDEVWAIARGKNKLEELQKDIPVPVRAIPLDLTDAESGNTIKNLLKEEKPIVAILCNASGFGIFNRFDKITEEDNLGMIDLNCRALTQLTYLCLPYLTEGSVVVNIASEAAFQPVPFISVYAATKAYVLSFSRALNRELKPLGIRVLAVCPYWTKTSFFERSNKNSVITRFDCMYETAFIVDRVFRAMKKRKDYVVPGTVAKCTHALTKLLPHKFVMSVFLKQQKLNRKQKTAAERGES